MIWIVSEKRLLKIFEEWFYNKKEELRSQISQELAASYADWSKKEANQVAEIKRHNALVEGWLKAFMEKHGVEVKK